MRDFSFRGKLEASRTDVMGYTVYVFRDMNEKKYDRKYIMCTRFPNWDGPGIRRGDTGYVKVRYVEEGKDVWYDGTNYVPYKNTDCHFIDFISDRKPSDVETVLDDQ